MTAEFILTVVVGFLISASYLSYAFYRDRKSLFNNDYSCESIADICEKHARKRADRIRARRPMAPRFIIRRAAPAMAESRLSPVTQGSQR